MYDMDTVLMMLTGALWMTVTRVTGHDVTLTGTQFVRDPWLVDVVPAPMDGELAGSVAECALACTRQTGCFGVFYSEVSRYCAHVTEYFLSELVDMRNVSYYKRQVIEKSRPVTLEFNMCPPLQDGVVRINMTSEKHYDIYVQHRAVTQTAATSECHLQGKQLLRMKEAWHSVYIKALLTTCEAFRNSLFWMGSTFNGSVWRFPDGDVLDMSYFCPYAHNDVQQLCAGFRHGCLDDESCDDTEGFICD